MKNTTYLKVALSMVFWGTAFISGRQLSQAGYQPMAIAFLRFSIASAFFIPALLFKGALPARLSPVQVLKIVLLGLTGIFAYNYFFFAGLGLVQAGKASVIIAINPTITAFLASFLMGEKLSLKKAGGVLLALTGALTVITQGDLSKITAGSFGRGEFYLLGGVASWVAYTLIGKIALKKITPLQATGLSCFVGTILLFPFAYRSGLGGMVTGASLFDWWNLFTLGFFATFLGFIWYYQGIKDLGAAKAAAFINLVPVVATSMGVLFLGESVSISFFAGAVLVLLGIKLSQS